jgi:formiminotetrahydrofolate cyclodeaminase
MSPNSEIPLSSREGIQAFLRVLDPSDNSTGGGAASAIAGAMAASLVAMVARLSKGKGKPDEFYEEVNRRALEISRALMKGAEEDSLAFDRVMEAYRMPKSTQEEMEERRRAISRSLEEAAMVPLENARLCGQILELCESLAPNANPNARSDLKCGHLLAMAAMRGCLENVKINLASLKDHSKAASIRDSLEELEGLVRGHDF